MHCWEHSVHMLSVTDLSSLWKGPRLISVAHIRGLLGAQGHNCFDGNCFLNWSTVGKTAEKELFWIALLVKKKKKRKKEKPVLAFHWFLPFEAVCYSLQVLVLRKETPSPFLCSLHQLTAVKVPKEIEGRPSKSFWRGCSLWAGNICSALLCACLSWVNRDVGSCLSQMYHLVWKALTLFRIILRPMGQFFGPLFSRLCLSSGHPCLWLFLVYDQGCSGHMDCFCLSRKVLNIVNDLSRQRRGKLLFPT